MFSNCPVGDMTSMTSSSSSSSCAFPPSDGSAPTFQSLKRPRDLAGLTSYPDAAFNSHAKMIKFPSECHQKLDELGAKILKVIRKQQHSAKKAVESHCMVEIPNAEFGVGMLQSGVAEIPGPNLNSNCNLQPDNWIGLDGTAIHLWLGIHIPITDCNCSRDIGKAILGVSVGGGTGALTINTIIEGGEVLFTRTHFKMRVRTKWSGGGAAGPNAPQGAVLQGGNGSGDLIPHQ